MNGDHAAFGRPADALAAGDLNTFWRTSSLLVLTFAWVVGWYWNTANEIFGIWWKSDTFAHGMVVLPIFAWLVWRKRGALNQNAPCPSPMLALAVLVAGSSWLVAELVSVSALEHVSLAFVLIASFVAVMGWRVARVLAFPLMFLLFGVPIGEFLLPVLMTYTADFTVAALRATGIPVYQEAFHFVVPNGRWSVVEACSGLRYLVASLMVGALYAYLNYVTLKRRLLFMLVALAVPIVANWIRAYITVMVGYHFGSEFVEGFIHIVYGWVFFGIVIFLMFMIGARWAEVPMQKDSRVVADTSSPSGRWLGVILVAVAVAIFPVISAALQRSVEPFAVRIDLPRSSESWVAIDGTKHNYRPTFLGHRGEAFQEYQRYDGAEVGLYIAYYAEQRPGNELVMHGNSLDGQEGSGWIRTRTGWDVLPIGRVRHAVLRRDRESVELWSWYWINGRVVTNDYFAKALLALDRLTGQTHDSAVVVVTAPVRDTLSSNREIAETFVGDMATSITASLRKSEASW